MNSVHSLLFAALVISSLAVNDCLALKKTRNVHGKAALYKRRNDKDDDGGKLQLAQMYEKSIPAVMGMATYNETLDLILGTYLAQNKDASIWPKVIEETQTWFGEVHERDDLERMEKRLNAFRKIVVNCHRETKGELLTKCLSGLIAEFVSAEPDFLWEKEQSVPKFLNYYTAFHLLKLASLQMIKIQKEHDDVNSFDVDSSIKREASEFSKTLKKEVGVACEQRVYKITDVKICTVMDILWQEYTDLCEKRLKKRSIDDEDQDEEQSHAAESKNNQDSENDEEDGLEATSDAEERTTKQPRIGGAQNDFSQSLRCLVKDDTTNQLIYNERMSVTPTMNKAKVIHKLYTEAMKARGKHVEKVEKACKKYWKGHGSNIADQIAKLVNQPKKKTKKNQVKGKKNENEDEEQ
eukprot:gene14909-16452_t